MERPMERARPCPRGAAERKLSGARCRCGREYGADAGLTIPEGRAYQHLSDMFLGRTYYIR